MVKDFLTLLSGFLTALLLFLGVLNIRFDWFTAESIDALVVLIGAGIALVINLYSVYKNTYVITEKARKQKQELEHKDLI